MCTAATYLTKDFYFGRTLDYEFSYGEEITITPRNYCLPFRNTAGIDNHYAIIGMAHIAGDYPLYYDAVNEKGLGMAGLNFVGNAVYHPSKPDKVNITFYELISWILSQCANVQEAKTLLKKTNITGTRFHPELPVAYLHWLIADKKESITVESMNDGLHIIDNPVGILTNNPPFDMQLFQLNNYMHLSPKDPKNQFSDKLLLKTYGHGMGTLGLPGDLSSPSRFIRAAYTKMNSISGNSEKESVSQFFHILGSVSQTRGCCEAAKEKYEITIYTSCCNAEKGIYYYTTYDNHQITGVNMYKEPLDGTELSHYPLIISEQIRMQN